MALQEKVKKVLELMMKEGSEAAKKREVQTIKDGLYYGYLTDEIIKKADEFHNKSKQPTPAKGAANPAAVQMQRDQDKFRLSDAPFFSYSSTAEKKGYSLAMSELQEQCKKDPASEQPIWQKKEGSKIYTPLTMQETIFALVDDFCTESFPDGKKRNLGERLKLFQVEFCTSSAIAYSAKKPNKFKFISFCHNLFEPVPKDKEPAIDYESINEKEFDTGQARCNEDFKDEKEVANNSLWQKIAGEQKLLEEFAKIIFKHLSPIGKKHGMAIYAHEDTGYDQVKSLHTIDLKYYAGIDATLTYNIPTRFLRVSKLAKPKKHI